MRFTTGENHLTPEVYTDHFTLIKLILCIISFYFNVLGFIASQDMFGSFSQLSEAILKIHSTTNSAGFRTDT